MTTAPTVSRQRWLIPALIVVVSLTIGTGLLAREVYLKPPPATGVTTAALPSSGALPPSAQPGPARVELTPDAQGHPQGEAVRVALQLFYDSINTRNYDRWAQTVSKDRLQGKTRDDWMREYRTTKDGSMLVRRIEVVPQNSLLRVLVSFTSTQDPKDAPPDLQEPCIRWRTVMSMVQENGQWKVDATPGASPDHEQC